MGRGNNDFEYNGATEETSVYSVSKYKRTVSSYYNYNNVKTDLFDNEKYSDYEYENFLKECNDSFFDNFNGIDVKDFMLQEDYEDWEDEILEYEHELNLNYTRQPTVSRLLKDCKLYS